MIRVNHCNLAGLSVLMDLIDVWWSHWMVVRLLHVAINQMIESDWRIVLSCPSLVFSTASVERKEPADVGFHPLSNFLLAFASETWSSGLIWRNGQSRNPVWMVSTWIYKDERGLRKLLWLTDEWLFQHIQFFWSSWPPLLLWFVVLLILYKCKMNGGLGSLRLEAAGALRTALVSAENLQLTLKSDLSLEEQALTNNHSSGNGEKPSRGYEKCSRIKDFHAQLD